MLVITELKPISTFQHITYSNFVWLRQTAVIPAKCVWVRRTDLLALQRETRTLQQNLRKAINSDLQQAHALLEKVEHG